MSDWTHRLLEFCHLGIDWTSTLVQRWENLQRPLALLLDRSIDAGTHLGGVEVHEERLAEEGQLVGAFFHHQY